MFSTIQAWNSYMIGLFIQKSHFHPYSIHSRFANEKIFCLLCLQVKIRKLTRDQLSSRVKFNSTKLFWISRVWWKYTSWLCKYQLPCKLQHFSLSQNVRWLISHFLYWRLVRKISKGKDVFRYFQRNILNLMAPICNLSISIHIIKIKPI